MLRHTFKHDHFQCGFHDEKLLNWVYSRDKRVLPGLGLLQWSTHNQAARAARGNLPSTTDPAEFHTTQASALAHEGEGYCGLG